MATDIVDTRGELMQAVQQPDAVVWIPEDVSIDVSGPSPNPIAPGVILASNRNLGNGTGGLIKTNDFDKRVFSIPEGGARVTGLRAKGPMMQYFDPPTDQVYDYDTCAFHFEGPTAIVDNCEMMGWTSMAIGIGTVGTATQGWIHHNNFHHNQMNHLGYPMELFNGISLIEWNYFAKYRHAITGYGYKTNGYEARFNVVGPPGGSEYSFAFDMHNLGEQANFSSGNMTAGRYVNVHHNVFELTDHNALSLSGIPTQYARFVNNWCATSKGGDGPGVPAVSAPAAAEVHKQQNTFGSHAVSAGRQWLTQLAAEIPLSNGVPSITAWTPPETVTNGNTTNSTATNTTEDGQ